MFNKVILVGNLTRDCELRYTQSGTAICATAIATNKKFKNQAGEQKEEVCFVDITFFGRTAEVANQYLGKGRKVLIEGRLKFEQWTDQNGGKRSKHTVTVDNMQMLGSRDDNQSGGDGYTQQPQQQSSYNNSQQPQQIKRPEGDKMQEVDVDEDELPF
jgi:single-strand DNA-binding protein